MHMKNAGGSSRIENGRDDGRLSIVVGSLRLVSVFGAAMAEDWCHWHAEWWAAYEDHRRRHDTSLAGNR